MRLFNRRYQKFIDNLDDQTLENHFNIQTEPNEKIKMNYKLISKVMNIIEINIRYSRKYYLPYLNLPIEICSLVSSYLLDDINIKFNINFGIAYPFEAPIWIIQEIRHNAGYSIEKYFEFKIYEYNKSHKSYWSAATLIEKDILELFLKINDFNILFDRNLLE
jgi:hypothetical protein